MTHEWTEIVLAVLRKNRYVLMGQRINIWEFPGGKINPNENPRSALKRELKEELGISAEIGPLRGIFCTQFQMKKKQLFYLFDISNWQNKIVRKVHNRLKWIKIHELEKMKLHQLNKIVLPEILSILQ